MNKIVTFVPVFAKILLGIETTPLSILLSIKCIEKITQHNDYLLNLSAMLEAVVL